MKEEFIKILADYWPIIVSSVLSLVTTIVTGVSLSLRHKLKLTRCDLEKARLNHVYFTCPKCGKKVTLSEVTFKLPNGDVDNDLDGFPDKLS